MSISPIPVVVNFSSPSCVPCQSFAPTFAASAIRRVGVTAFAKINTEIEASTAKRHGISSVLTLVVFHKGKEVARRSGAYDQNELDRWLTDGGRVTQK